MNEINHITIFGIPVTVNPVAFTLPFGGGWEIRWYGIIIALGFVLALLYAYLYSKRYNIDLDKALDVIIVTVPVAILCARAYYIIFDSDKAFSWSDFLPTGGGFSGLAIYGGVIGAFVCGGLMCRLKKINVLDMFDLAAVGFLIGQGVGRWGNFTNQEAFGSPTGSSFFGMTSENVRETFAQLGYNQNALAHPCFLYESIWCLAGVFLLHKLSKNRKFSGETFLMYGVWYGFGRTIIEGLRTDSLMIGYLRVSQVLSATLCIVCAVLLAVMRSRVKQNENVEDYQNILSNQNAEIEEEEENE